MGDVVYISVMDPKLFFSDPDSDPTFQEISDPDPISDPTLFISKEALIALIRAEAPSLGKKKKEEEEKYTKKRKNSRSKNIGICKERRGKERDEMTIEKNPMKTVEFIA